MPLASWSVPFSLTSALYSGSPLSINTVTASGIYLLRPDGCALRTSVRSVKDDIPQADGSILHRRFVSGMEMDLAIQLWSTTDVPACNEQAQVMLDELLGYLRGLLNAGDNEGRISWSPDGDDDRMLDDIRLLTYPEESLADGGAIEIAVTVDTPFPYSMDVTQLSPSLATGNTVVVNAGNTDTWPVFQIDDASSSFTLTNSTLPGSPSFIYDGAAFSGYAEIDMFRNTIYQNGDETNLKAGVDVLNSEFFHLAPGNNTINLTSTTGTALINAAWA